MIPSCTLHVGDNLTVLESLPADHFQCIVTSPPYFALRDYGLPPSAWPEITFVPMIGCPSITVPAESCCLGLEADPMAFVAHMVHVFRLARRVLRPDGVVFMNFGDSMSQSGGHGRQGQTSQRKGRANVEAQEKQDPVKPPPGFKAKDMMGIPWRVAFALQADGWYLRQDIIWSKPNPMPESAKDRCTKAHEYIFLLSKRPRYYWDLEAIKEAASENTNPRRAAIKSPDGWDTGSGSHGGFHKKGREKGKTRKLAEAGGTIKNNTSYESAMAGMVSSRNKRSVWTVGSEPCPEAHFATYPKALVRPMIRAASSAAGCCSACGAPLLRIVETGEPDLARQQACLL